MYCNVTHHSTPQRAPAAHLPRERYTYVAGVLVPVAQLASVTLATWRFT